jgi:N-acetylmuramoyl-L-alanine amidase
MTGMRAPSSPPWGQYEERLPLASGDEGDAVVDLQQRLTKLGYPCGGGAFDGETELAVRSFQRLRGLRENGIVDLAAWSVIVEAGYQLGDRALYRRRPMFRGDDVAELQRRLSQLGFDPGRIDGIFGDETVVALMDFQRNAGLTMDGVLGRRTLVDLHRLTIRKGAADLVSPLRERLLLATGTTKTLAGRRIAVGDGGGFASGVASVCRALEHGGATAIAVQHPDASHRAAEANASEVDCLIDLQLIADRSDCTVAYYRGFRYESMASKHLAELVQANLASSLGLDDGGTAGMALPILRETRMPAIEIQLGSPIVVVRRTADLARVLALSLGTWVATSWD